MDDRWGEVSAAMPSRRGLRAFALSMLLGGAAACAPVPAPAPTMPAAVEVKGPTAIPELGQAAPEPTIRALVEACVASQTGDVERARIVQYLASIKSAAGERCYVHALREYRPGVTDEIVGVAGEAVGALRIEAARGPLFEAFAKMRASRSHGAYRAVYEAMIALADPAWEPRLLAFFDRTVDAKNVTALTDEMFWLQTAITILGRQRSEAAVRPLLRVLLAAEKAAAHLDALMALLRIGKPAVPAATALLKQGEVGTAAVVLGTLGRAESIEPMIDALAVQDPARRALVARELSKLPADPRTIAAYRGVVDAFGVTLRGRSAREDLVERAAEFFDSSLVPWLADGARKLKGDREEMRANQEAALLAALKVARAHQVKHLDALAKLGNKAFSKEIAITKELLAACGDRVDCWLDELASPASQQEGAPFRGVKAAYMIGVLGDAAAKGKLIALMPRLTSPAVRNVAGLAIDHLSPQGDAAAAAALQQIADGPLKTVILRLQSRLP
jgi:hypothetical protein